MHCCQSPNIIKEHWEHGARVVNAPELLAQVYHQELKIYIYLCICTYIYIYIYIYTYI